MYLTCQGCWRVKKPFCLISKLFDPPCLFTTDSEWMLRFDFMFVWVQHSAPFALNIFLSFLRSLRNFRTRLYTFLHLSSHHVAINNKSTKLWFELDTEDNRVMGNLLWRKEMTRVWVNVNRKRSLSSSGKTGLLRHSGSIETAFFSSFAALKKRVESSMTHLKNSRAIQRLVMGKLLLWFCFITRLAICGMTRNYIFFFFISKILLMFSDQKKTAGWVNHKNHHKTKLVNGLWRMLEKTLFAVCNKKKTVRIMDLFITILLI